MIGGFVGTPIGGVVNNGNFYLSVTAGSYTITGQSAAFNAKVAVSAGSYTISGSAALFADTMVASAGAYAITGQGATFVAKLAAVAGSYAITGNAATFATVLHVGSGFAVGGYVGAGIGGVIYQAAPKPDATYQITGQSAAFTTTETNASGSYALTGTAIAFRVTMPCATGVYALTGSPAFYSEVIHGAGGGTKKHYRGKLEIERRKITIRDDEGRVRKVDLLRHLKPPPPFTGPAPDWALPRVRDLPPPVAAALPMAPTTMPAPQLPQSLLALQDARDEGELIEFLTNTPDPLVEDIRQVLGILAATGQLERLLETA